MLLVDSFKYVIKGRFLETTADKIVELDKEFCVCVCLLKNVQWSKSMCCIQNEIYSFYFYTMKITNIRIDGNYY